MRWSEKGARRFKSSLPQKLNFYKKVVYKNKVFLYSHKELQNKNNSELQDMCWEKGKNWNDLEISLKRGRCCVKKTPIDTESGKGIEVLKSEWFIENEIPIFTHNPNYIEKYLAIEEE